MKNGVQYSAGEMHDEIDRLTHLTYGLNRSRIRPAGLDETNVLLSELQTVHTDVLVALSGPREAVTAEKLGEAMQKEYPLQPRRRVLQLMAELGDRLKKCA